MTDPRPRTIYSTDIVNGVRVVTKTLPTGVRVVLRGEEIEVESMRLELQAAEAVEERARLDALSVPPPVAEMGYPRRFAVNREGTWHYFRQATPEDCLKEIDTVRGMIPDFLNVEVVTEEQIAAIERDVDARIAAKMVNEGSTT